MSVSSASVVAKNLINLFAQPDTSSEVVTQAILGDRLTHQEQQDGFVYVVGDDRYCGWADTRHLLPWKDADGQSKYTVSKLVSEVYSQPDHSSELLSKLVLSTKIPLLEITNGAFTAVELPNSTTGFMRTTDLIKEESLITSQWNGSTLAQRETLVRSLGQKVIECATRLIGVPYLWGGCTPFGIDCSGLVQLAYKVHGVQLLRDADIQFGDRRFARVDPNAGFDKANLVAGDIVAFNNGSGITHIGIADGNGRFIHASGRQNNFGTYFDSCANPDWIKRYSGAIRLSVNASLEVQHA